MFFTARRRKWLPDGSQVAQMAPKWFSNGAGRSKAMCFHSQSHAPCNKTMFFYSQAAQMVPRWLPWGPNGSQMAPGAQCQCQHLLALNDPRRKSDTKDSQKQRQEPRIIITRKTKMSRNVRGLIVCGYTPQGYNLGWAEWARATLL